MLAVRKCSAGALAYSVLAHEKLEHFDLGWKRLLSGAALQDLTPGLLVLATTIAKDKDE